MCMKMVHPFVGLELNHHEAFGSHPELPMQEVCAALRKKTSIFCIKDFLTPRGSLGLATKEGFCNKLWSLSNMYLKQRVKLFTKREAILLLSAILPRKAWFGPSSGYRGRDKVILECRTLEVGCAMLLWTDCILIACHGLPSCVPEYLWVNFNQG